MLNDQHRGPAVVEPQWLVIIAESSAARANGCWVPCDHVSVRSWALFKARDVLRELIRTLKAEQSVVKVA